MKASYNWLKEFVDLRLTAEDLAERLLQLGFEVAAIEARGPAFSGVVTGHVLSVEKHPNADRLSLCVVEAGGEKHSVVCGAKNVAAGQKVPLARVGAILPGGLAITRAKIRGVESHGMICSRRELGLGGNGEGIWVMDPSSPSGADVAELLGGTDRILDVELTPNRPDCLSHLGLARELAAFLRLPLKPRPEPKLPAAHGPCAPARVEDERACPRYVGRVFENLSIRPSPAWLAAKLESVGLRPINNLVDITNYLLMDAGQPMHAFDLDALEGGIVVRFARSGEKIAALDEKEYQLSERCLVIADQARPVAIAGIMGGLKTGVTEKTRRAFLESACFDPATVRRGSQLLKLKSDASYRFERGADPEAAGSASLRAAELIVSLCGPDVRMSEPIDLRAAAAAPAPIAVTSARINEILGSDFAADAVEGTLRALGGRLEKQDQTLRLTPPSWRRDLATVWDLAEEVARLAGYESIPYETPSGPLQPSRLLPGQAVAERCRSRLCGLGLAEACNYDFISDKAAAQAGLPGPLVRVMNPISEDYANLRPSLFAGLLRNARLNLNNGARTLRLFELGKSYRLAKDGVVETTQAAGLLLGQRQAHWQAPRGRRLDFYDAKGVVEGLLAAIPGLAWRPFAQASGDSDPFFHPRASLRLFGPKGPLACAGLLHPRAARAWELEREEASLFEVDLDALARLEPPRARFAPFGVFPGSDRDLSFLVDAKTRYGDVEAAVLGAGVAELRAVELVDKFTGPGVPTGKQSLTIRLRLGRDDRTLKDAELSQAAGRVLEELVRKLGAVLRS
ncbi:MAG: phenylalanine--tRNA ligase subunit beta [Elusimicrobia bacterium]|nr:phenylalanine--tRNA ligase subunit beta [Elusimicrobiota bacterium]